MPSTSGVKSSSFKSNISKANLQTQSLQPEADKISRNSSIGGMSHFSILDFIILVASASIPGKPPNMVGMCIAGFPTVAT